MLLERDALESKNYQLMLIDEAVQKAISSKRLKTYLPIVSSGIKDLFCEDKTQKQVLCNMLQHEFSVQIKGRTDCTIDTYYDIKSIANGIPCATKTDKEFIFSIFLDYQNELLHLGTFDVDDVTMEALSRLNAPIWRRERATEGFDYIFADEMHLFTIFDWQLILLISSLFSSLPMSSSFTAANVVFSTLGGGRSAWSFWKGRPGFD